MKDIYGTIENDGIQQEDDMKRKDILANHPYSINRTKVVSNGKTYYRWITFVQVNGKRKQIKRKTKGEVENYLVDFYNGNIDIVTFRDCYNNWLEFKKYIVSDNTVYKYEYDYVRFFKNTEFERMDISKINEKEILKFLADTAKNKHLLKKAFKSLTGYVNEILDCAVCDKYIERNPFIFAKPRLKLIERQYVTDSYHTKDDRLISDNEIQKLMTVIHKDYISKPEIITPYTIEFALLTGCRIGEIAAVRWSDIENGIITIRSSEKTHRSTTQPIFYTIETTKTGKERKIPVTDMLADLLQRVSDAEERINCKGEFIFSDRNGRIKTSSIASCLTRKCKQCGISRKSIHSCRRTLNSTLKSVGANTSIAASLLGHTAEVNDSYYTYDISGLDYKKELLEQANENLMN